MDVPVPADTGGPCYYGGRDRGRLVSHDTTNNGPFLSGAPGGIEPIRDMTGVCRIRFDVNWLRWAVLVNAGVNEIPRWWGVSGGRCPG
ncbi:hypothetical protein GGTG_09860 [Gaeumannomyces tritici R3-111a-1]|uniref:Uncharacterized protein n=1 Tax=Gaeumannomyces tritici (strain R3-111a-1) TaxID=644352 RepID=J3P8M5_GAET3|nr:hypothetical protein GGTG_09860 [Gaeumannomyces tritici R3-111a-1]EJT73009.1 hypothetical protein GGTG_09860 [Gaeumannomyces tritici R3-111a-1]